MKKRCTNSECRKYFSEGNVCPHCGKKYPRIKSSEYEVKLINAGEDRISVVRIIRTFYTGISLPLAKKFIDICPCVLATGLSEKEANNLYKSLIKVGATAKVLPVT